MFGKTSQQHLFLFPICQWKDQAKWWTQKITVFCQSCFHPRPVPPKTSSINSCIRSPISCRLFNWAPKYKKPVFHCFFVSILMIHRHIQGYLSCWSTLTEFKKCGLNYALRWSDESSSKYSCGNGGVMWGWQIYQSYEICGAGADMLHSSMMCHHHPGRHMVAAQHHSLPANPISCPTMTCLCR